AFSSGVCTSARVSDPMRRKFAGRLASVFSAVFTFTRGISSILRSMKTFTPTTPATTRGNATASATAKRPSRTRGNDRVIEQVIVPAEAEVPGSHRKTEAGRHGTATLRQMTPGGAPTAAALLAALPESADAAVVRDQRYFVVAIEPDAVVVASGADALDGLDRLPPGWWAGFLAYELGGAVERVRPGRSTAGSQHEDRVPDLVLARFPTRVVLDPASGRYSLPPPAPPPRPPPPPLQSQSQPAPPGRDGADSHVPQPRSGRVRAGRGEDPRAHRRRGLLPGQPHAPVDDHACHRPRGVVRRARARQPVAPRCVRARRRRVRGAV